jgi:hypothetical protein
MELRAGAKSTRRGRASFGDSQPPTTVQVGGRRVSTLQDRLDRLDRAEEEYRKSLESGLAGRIVTEATTAPSIVHTELLAARGELFVLDPYFGGNAPDWQVLSGLSISTRVQTGAKAKPPPAPLPAVTARRLEPALRRRTPDFHDRLYRWDGGGISVCRHLTLRPRETRRSPLTASEGSKQPDGEPCLRRTGPAATTCLYRRR